MTVHVVPHSHNDVGWLRTAEQYYDTCVHHIITNTINNLYDNPSRKFIWVETMFFEMWWSKASLEMRDKVHRLVSRKQWEFILGGWCMPDEATPTYSGVINEFTLGHLWMKKHLNITPTTGWEIDPFGYSTTLPKLFSRMGFKDHVICRVDYESKNTMKISKSLEFNWLHSPSIVEPSKMHTIVLPYHYNHYHGYNWEESCAIPFNYQLNPKITRENIKERADRFVEWLKETAVGFTTKHIIYPFGDDFTFVRPEWNFSNMTLLMEYINEHTLDYDVEMKFSLLTEYLQALRDDLGRRPPLLERSGDFFPYLDLPIAPWTGFYSSYPIIKEATRYGEKVARFTETLYSLAQLHGHEDRDISPQESFERLQMLRKANSQLQHHDGVTGTSRIQVRHDYLQKIARGTQQALTVAIDSLSRIVKRQSPHLKYLRLSYSSHNVIQVNPTTALKTQVILWNSLGWLRDTERVRLKVSQPVISIRNSLDVDVPFDSIGECQKEEGTNNCLYLVDFEPSVNALGYHVYTLHHRDPPSTVRKGQPMGAHSGKEPSFNVRLSKQGQKRSSKVLNLCSHQSKSLSIGMYEITFCSCALCRIHNKVSNITIDKITQEFLYYTSGAGIIQKSGAYIFIPNGENARAIQDIQTEIIHEGKTRVIIHQKIGKFIEQNITLSAKSSFIDFNIRTGILPQSTELVTRFSIDDGTPNTSRKFFTDNNGLLMHERKYRSHLEEVSANYYPLVYSAYMQLPSLSVNRNLIRQLTFLTNSSVGFGITKQQNPELMIHRRTPYDDNRGVLEPLNDTDYGYLNLRIGLDTLVRGEMARQTGVYDQNFPLTVFQIVETTKPSDNTTALVAAAADIKNGEFSGVIRDLPKDLHILSFDWLESESRKVLMRLQNVKLQMGEGGGGNSSSIILKDWLRSMDGVSSVKEISLTGLQYHGEVNPRSEVVVPITDIKTFEVTFNKLPFANDGK